MGRLAASYIGVRNPTNGLWNTSYFDIPSTGLPVGWTPTSVLRIPTTWGYTGQQEMTVTISTWGTPATWQVDDVYVDPFRST